MVGMYVGNEHIVYDQFRVGLYSTKHCNTRQLSVSFMLACKRDLAFETDIFEFQIRIPVWKASVTLKAHGKHIVEPQDENY